jgi:exopolysaccharide production protein ExoY
LRMDNFASTGASRGYKRRSHRGTARRSTIHLAHSSNERVWAPPHFTQVEKPPLLQEQYLYRVAKRSFDILFALMLCPLLVPLMFVLMGVVRISSKGPVFYRQRRVGQNGRLFYLLKFRTMFPDSDSVLTRHLARTPEAQQEWEMHYKLRKDPRVTRVGATLRRMSLDELPQILNVLAGDMSFVGPRPIVRDELSRYGQDVAFYTAARPGITGLWQISGRGRLSYDARVALDVQYVKNWSLARDFSILLKTAPAIARCEGAY